MARSYPGDTRLQNFYNEQFENEMYNRLRSYHTKQRGGGDSNSACSAIGYRGQSSTLPLIHPGKFARDMSRKEKEERAIAIAEAKKQQSKEEMKKASSGTLTKLYDGISREGKGRLAYLKERHEINPEGKYSFPVLSSWQYGWLLGPNADLQKPKHARSRKIADTFYTRNGIPDVQHERPYTTT